MHFTVFVGCILISGVICKPTKDVLTELDTLRDLTQMEMRKLEGLNEKLRSEVEILEHKVDSLSAANKRMTLETAKNERDNHLVFFSASATESANYTMNDVVLFPRVTANFGNAYNDTSSVFTCPFEGYYMFLATIYNHSSQNNPGYLDLVKNGLRIISLLSTQAAEMDVYTSSTMQAIVECAENDQVWVQMFSGGTVFSDPELRLQHFSGFLVREGLE